MDLSRFSQEAVLRDGSPVLIRAIRPDDKQRLFEGFHHLSSRSISLRFFTRKKDLTENELKYLTEVDFNQHVAIVAELENEGKEDDIGVGRYIELKDKGPDRVAEIALTVDDEHQSLGVGTLLFQLLVALAQKQGISRLVADILLDNKSMLKIIEHSGFKLETTISYGVAHVEFNIEKKDTGLTSKRKSDYEWHRNGIKNE